MERYNRGNSGGYGGGNSGGYDRGGQDQFFAPVKVGDEINVKIEAVGEKGDGVARIKGFVIFVPNTQAGDEVKVKVTRVLKKVGFGEVLGKADGPISADGDAPQERSPSKKAPRKARTTAPVEEVEDTEDFGDQN